MKLTRNFTKQEFESKDGSPMPDDVLSNVIKLATQLQIIRDAIDEPLHINSAYRSPEHNKRIGGVKNSQHVFGKAADLTTKNLTPEQLHYVIEELINDGNLLQGGLGLYNGFVHYDIRGKKARWDYRK